MSSRHRNSSIITVILIAMVFILSCESDSDTGIEKYWDKLIRIGCVNDAMSIQATSEGGVVAAGYTDNAGWVLKTDAKGNTLWLKLYSDESGAQNFQINCIEQTLDGGYIVAGSTSFTVGDRGDAWFAKLNADGSVLWQKTGGGVYTEGILSIRQTADEGYIMAGYTSSSGAGFRDFWIIKLTENGGISWQKTFGGYEYDTAFDIQQCADKGYVVVGHTGSFDLQSYDFWVIRLSAEGSLVWQKSYGGEGIDEAQAVQQTADGGFVVSGFLDNKNIDLDMFILRLDASGSILWNKAYGTSGTEVVHAFQLTSNQGFIMAGTAKFSGDDLEDIWILELDKTGEVIWQKTYGGNFYDNANALAQAADGSFFVAGTTASFSESSYYDECQEQFRQYSWILKLESNGNCPPFGEDTECIIDIPSISEATTHAIPENTSVLLEDTNCTVSDINASAI